MSTSPDPRLINALITLENRYGGLVTNVPRNRVSPHDPRSKEELERGGMIGGDRMSRHGYAPKYAQYLKKFLRKKDLVLVEVGILKGSGLAIWCDIFRHATILGLDIDLDHFNNNKAKLLSLGAFRKNTPILFHFDQLECKIPSPLLGQLEKTGIDIVIDDGLHSSQAITNTIQLLQPHLKKDWIYFIEDNSNGRNLARHFFKGYTLDWEGELTIITPKDSKEEEISGNREDALKTQISSMEGKIAQLESRIKHLNNEMERRWDILKYEIYSTLSHNHYKDSLCRWYQRATGKLLPIGNPITFNEKLQYLKLFDNFPLKTICTDKLLVRNYVKSTVDGDILVPFIGSYDNPEEIDFQSLPNQFIIKVNHGSGWNIVVKDKQSLDPIEANKKLKNWLSKNYAFIGGFELNYKDIVPKIIIEQYLSDLKTNLYDYRFFCFSGEPFHVWIDEASGTPRHKRTIRDLDFKEIHITTGWPRLDTEIARPSNFDEMIVIARKLSTPFRFVRVDLYNVNGKIYFGELTFYPQSGLAKWSDEDYNKLYGSKIDLTGLG